MTVKRMKCPKCGDEATIDETGSMVCCSHCGWWAKIEIAKLKKEKRK